MPEEFDPAWEYWTGDLEVEEILAEESETGGFEIVNESYYRSQREGFNIGMRFGKGELQLKMTGIVKDRTRRWTLSKRNKPKADGTDTPPVEYAMCPTCGVRFEMVRSGHKKKYCSDKCYKRPGAVYRRVRTRSETCHCGKAFEPKRVGQVCCSRKCGGMLSKRNQWGPK